MQKIRDHIYYIGVQDDNIDYFESLYPVHHGISYNSYVIFGEKKAVIDAVDVRRKEDWFAMLDELFPRTAGSSPDYLIIQHAEPDHSGSVAEFLERYPSTRLVCTSKAADMLRGFFREAEFEDRLDIVGDGSTLSLGDRELTFVTAPMVHWPEVMVTLDPTDGILFSADAFGSFAQWTSTEAWDDEARRYYTNIVGRFGANVQSLLKKLSGFVFTAIAPLHGPMLEGDLSHYVNLYDLWSRYEPECDGVLVAYGSVYGGTAEAARRLVSQLENRGVERIELMDLARHDVSYAVAETFRYRNLVVGSVTYDAALFPPVEDFIHHLERKNVANRRVALIENGTWAPIAGRLMADRFAKMKNMTVIDPVLSIRSRLKPSDMVTLNTFADRLATKD